MDKDLEPLCDLSRSLVVQHDVGIMSRLFNGSQRETQKKRVKQCQAWPRFPCTSSLRNCQMPILAVLDLTADETGAMQAVLGKKRKALGISNRVRKL